MRAHKGKIKDEKGGKKGVAELLPGAEAIVFTEVITGYFYVKLSFFWQIKSDYTSMSIKK